MSRISTITATLAKNANINNNNNSNIEDTWKHTKVIYFDPSQEQSTDLPTTTIHDQ